MSACVWRKRAGDEGDVREVCRRGVRGREGGRGGETRKEACGWGNRLMCEKMKRYGQYKGAGGGSTREWEGEGGTGTVRNAGGAEASAIPG